MLVHSGTASRGLAAVLTALTAGVGGDLASAAGALWLRGSDGTITKIDPTTGDLIERITLGQPMSGGSLLLAPDSIWTTSADQGILHRLCQAT